MRLQKHIASQINAIQTTATNANNLASQAVDDSLDAKNTGLQAFTNAGLAQDDATSALNLVSGYDIRITDAEDAADDADEKSAIST